MDQLFKARLFASLLVVAFLSAVFYVVTYGVKSIEDFEFECEKRGGIAVKTRNGIECIKAERIVW